MSYAEFADKLSASAGNVIQAVQHNDEVDGIQSEFELRDGDGFLDGVVTGLTPTIDNTNHEIDLAAGRAYCQGKRFTGNVSVAFSGAASDTYYVYIDPTDESDPYKRATSDPGSGYLVLCTVAWNGTDTLSSLVDLRPLGVLPLTIHAAAPGSVSTGTVANIAISQDLWIESVSIVLGDCGTAASTIVDVEKGASGSAPASIFSSESDRPTLANTDADYTVASNTSNLTQTNRQITAGQQLRIVVDAAATGASDLGVTIAARQR